MPWACSHTGGRAAARCLPAGLEELAHVQRLVQTGSGTCRIPLVVTAGSATASPHPTTTPASSPQKPGGLLEVKRGPGSRESLNQEGWH